MVNGKNTTYYSSKEISLRIYFRINENCTIIYPDSNKNYFNDTSSVPINTMMEFKENLVNSITSNPDSVQYWKSEEIKNPVDSLSYFYLPICIEKERDHKVSGNFFTVIA